MPDEMSAERQAIVEMIETSPSGLSADWAAKQLRNNIPPAPPDPVRARLVEALRGVIVERFGRIPSIVELPIGNSNVITWGTAIAALAAAEGEGK